MENLTEKIMNSIKEYESKFIEDDIGVTCGDEIRKAVDRLNEIIQGNCSKFDRTEAESIVKLIEKNILTQENMNEKNERLQSDLADIQSDLTDWMNENLSDRDKRKESLEYIIDDIITLRHY